MAKSSAIALLAAGALAPVAFAQQAPPGEPLGTATATVEVKANADTIRRNDTASRIVVGHDELVKFGDTSALDAMKRLPGVTVVDGGVRMRGLGSGYTQVLVDGQRMPAGFSLESLAPDAIEKIEVIRAATAEYSTESIAGTINIVLRKTLGKDSGEFKLGTGGGPGYRAPGLTLARSGKEGRLAYTVGATLTHWTRAFRDVERVAGQDATALPTGLRETRSDYDQHFTIVNTNARLSWALGGGGTLAWQSFLNSGRARGSEGNRTTTFIGPAYPYPLLPAGFGSDSASLRSDVALAKSLDGGAKLDLKIALDLSQLDRTLGRRGLRDGALVYGADDKGKIRDREVNITGKVRVPLLEGHAFAVGWDAGIEHNREHDLRTELPLPGTVPLDVDRNLHASIDRLALYGQDEWDLRQGWSVYLGARWEGLRTRAAGSDFAAVVASHGVFSPLMQTVWKIPGSKQDQLRLALTRTFRAPPLPQLLPTRLYATLNTATEPDYLGNPDLRPELATGLDAAYEHYFAGGGLVSINATTRAIRDAIRSTTSFDGARWISRPVNQGEAKVRSLALESKLPLTTLGLAWPVAMRANLNRNWSRVDGVPGPDNRLDQQPRWSANLGVDYSAGAFNAGTSFNFVTGGPTRTSVQQWQYRGVTRELEAYALYKFDPRRQLRFTAKNLLAPDKLSGTTYADAAGATMQTLRGPSWRSWRLQYEQTFR